MPKAPSLLLLLLLGISATVSACTSDDGETGEGSASARMAAGCDPCTIALDEIAAITDRDAPDGAKLTHPTAVTTDHRGRFFAAEADGQSARIIVFDASGSATSVLESRGQGPGEFLSISPPVVTPDREETADLEFLIFDPMARKVVILRDDLSFDREFRPPYAPHLPLGEGRFLVHHPIPESDRAGFHFHLMDESAEVFHSFGAGGDFDVEEPWRFRQTMALTPDGLLWATPSESRLNLRLLDPRDGSTLRTLPTTWERFQPMEAGMRRDPRRFHPTSSIQGLIPDPDKHLVWVLVQTPVRDWRPSRDPALPISVEEETTREERVAAYEWVLLALDDTTGEVLAEGAVEGPVFVSPGNDFLTT